MKQWHWFATSHVTCADPSLATRFVSYRPVHFQRHKGPCVTKSAASVRTQSCERVKKSVTIVTAVSYNFLPLFNDILTSRVDVEWHFLQRMVLFVPFTLRSSLTAIVTSHVISCLVFSLLSFNFACEKLFTANLADS